MWLITIALLVWISFLYFILLCKDAEYLGEISSLKLEIETKNKQIWNLENEIKHLKNPSNYEPEV
jgi:cell division protein FtsL